MNDAAEARRRSWLVAALLAGALYAAVGILFALPTSHVRAWRLAAWAFSGLVFAGHLCYERFRLNASTASAALHAASAAALGAFGLALAATAHSALAHTGSQHRHLLLIALVVWSFLAGVPAFLVGFMASALFRRWSRRGDTS